MLRGEGGVEVGEVSSSESVKALKLQIDAFVSGGGAKGGEGGGGGLLHAKFDEFDLAAQHHYAQVCPYVFYITTP